MSTNSAQFTNLARRRTEYARNQNFEPYIRGLVKISQIHNFQYISIELCTIYWFDKTKNIEYVRNQNWPIYTRVYQNISNFKISPQRPHGLEKIRYFLPYKRNKNVKCLTVLRAYDNQLNISINPVGLFIYLQWSKNPWEKHNQL